MSFQIGGKYAQAAKCDKSRILTKVIYCIISIDKFEQQCVVLEVMLQPPHSKYHMKTIGIDQSLIKSAFFEQKCLQKIKKLSMFA